MLWVVDNFYPNPDEIREQALTLDYKSGRDPSKDNHVQYPGWRALTKGTYNWHKNRIYLRNRWSEITGKRVVNFEHQSGNCAFNVGFADKENRFNWIHSDDGQDNPEQFKMYACVIYLTPNPPPRTGTLLFEVEGSIYDEQVKTREKYKYYSKIRGNYWEDPISRESNFKVHTVVGNRYNRCIIYEASMLHAPEDAGFGTTFEDARLTQIGFWYGED